jgi:hypothetical protein
MRAMIITADSILLRPKLDYNGGYDVAVKGPSIVVSDPWFADYLLCIGGGTEEVNGDGDVRIPDEIYVPYTDNAEKDLHRLIGTIFLDLMQT